MTTATTILAATAVALLLVGAVTGIAMARQREDGPDTDTYLRFAHLAAYGQAPILLGVIVLLDHATPSPTLATVSAVTLASSAVLLVAKDLVNWRTGTRDEFAEHGTGYRIGLVFGPVHLVAIVALGIVVVGGA